MQNVSPIRAKLTEMSVHKQTYRGTQFYNIDGNLRRHLLHTDTIYYLLVADATDIFWRVYNMFMADLDEINTIVKCNYSNNIDVLIVHQYGIFELQCWHLSHNITEIA